ncbi:MAG: NADH-quinone oxidoreductase subunit A [Candidatus Thorarchaeota archaeon]
MQTDRLFLQFIPVLVWAILVIVLIVIMLLASWVLRPHILQNSEKTSTYECGEEPIGPARMSFPYSYIIYTVLFVIIDVMGAFLWLLSVSPLRLNPVVAWQTFIFVVIIMGAIGYAMRYLPQASLDGKETLEAYRAAKARHLEKPRHPGREHN